MKALTDGCGTIRYTYLNEAKDTVTDVREAKWAVPTVGQQYSQELVTGVSIEQAEKYVKLGLWRGATHWMFFHKAVERHGDTPAVQDSVRALSWIQLADTVDRAAQALHDHGISAGNFVVLQLPNSVAFLETVLALWKLGAVPIFCLSEHGALEVQHCIEQTGAGFYIGPRTLTPHLRRVAKSVDDTPEIIHIEVPIESEDPWAEWIPQGIEVQSPTHHGLASELAFLQLSGGTTGAPKLIPKTHDDYLYSVRASIERCDLDAHSSMLIVLPAAHNFTMSSPGILGAISVGAQIVFGSGTQPLAIKNDIAIHRITHCAFVPPILLSVLNSMDSPEADQDLSSLRTVWVGGAKLSSAVASRVNAELGCALTQVFGMAEGLVNYTYLESTAPDDFTPEQILWESINTQGHPVSEWDELKILGSTGLPVEPGIPGELYTRGPYTIRRYFNPKYADSFTSEGYYHTGDIVKQTSTGTLVVVGRSKDQINRGGEKVSPELVENLLLGHELVHNVSVVGIPDEVLGEKIQAYVIPRRNAPREQLSARGLRKFLKQEGLASYALPDFIEFVEDFPLTAVGKVSKKDQQAQ